MGARGMYLYSGNKDTLYRIHGTNQPEYIGQAISSGCIRMTNEDVIDLYNHVKVGTIVVVLAPKNGDAPYSPQMASTVHARRRRHGEARSEFQLSCAAFNRRRRPSAGAVGFFGRRLSRPARCARFPAARRGARE